MKIFSVALVLALSLSGCTFHRTPHITYSNTDQPLANTAVFSTAGFVSNSQGQVLSVDGKSTSCWQVGCPVWVRVLPGDHTFRIRYTVVDSLVTGIFLGPRQGEADLTIKDMKPRHLYEAVFQVDGNTFSVSAKDLGENPDYGMRLGMPGVNQQYFRVSFE